MSQHLDLSMDNNFMQEEKTKITLMIQTQTDLSPYDKRKLHKYKMGHLLILHRGKGNTSFSDTEKCVCGYVC